jgi:alkanesulfonate monooxygenase SsuD/methylene tetrahydromethanopterin reductase-like flavin-dependent oxidoreductase (luciferase family)
MPRTIHLALHPYGVGGPGQHGLWKDSRVAKNASIDIQYYIQQAQAAEHALFDAFFIVDSQFINSTYPAHYLNRLEPLTLLSAVAVHTTHIGLVATASSTYNSPFNLARRLASLDHISGGRAGWNVVTSFDTGTSRNYGLDEHLDYTTRYGRALEREIAHEDNDFERNLALLGRGFGAHDFSQYDPDGPFPDVAHLAERGGRTGATKLIERARRENLTLRQVVESVSDFKSSAFVGSPQTVADTIETWFSAGTFDGINLAFRTTEELTLFVDGVVPILQKRGLFRTEYEADTLRDHLGLPIPANRYVREPESVGNQG